jgi:hypothetical protein
LVHHTENTGNETFFHYLLFLFLLSIVFKNHFILLFFFRLIGSVPFIRQNEVEFSRTPDWFVTRKIQVTKLFLLFIVSISICYCPLFLKITLFFFFFMLGSVPFICQNEGEFSRNLDWNGLVRHMQVKKNPLIYLI